MALQLDMRKTFKELFSTSQAVPKTEGSASSPKPNGHENKKNYPNILDEHGCNILNKILANEIQQHIKKNTMITWAPSQGCDDD